MILEGGSGLRIREAMDKKGVKQSELSKITGISPSSLSDYINGRYEAKQDKLYKIATALNVSPAWLMGYPVPMENIKDPAREISATRVPVIGEIAAGVPIYADHKYDYVQFNNIAKFDFCLIVKGDSMIDARINDGDIVFCKSQSEVENGEIAVVIIDDEATLKKFYKNNGIVQLIPANPKYAPMVFDAKSNKNIRVIGKALAFQSVL